MNDKHDNELLAEAYEQVRIKESNCTICGKPVTLSPSAKERAKKAGGKPSDYTKIFTAHADCQLKKRKEGTSELIKRRTGIKEESDISKSYQAGQGDVLGRDNNYQQVMPETGNDPALFKPYQAPAEGDAQAALIAKLPTMSLSEIARVCRRDWKKLYFGVVPYLNALFSMNSINDNYGMDDGRSIVAYFLSNASQWKGPIAKAVKLELNKRLKTRS